MCPVCDYKTNERVNLDIHLGLNHKTPPSKGRKISLPYENRDGFLEQKFWLSRLLLRTVLLDLDTRADDVRPSGPSYRCGRQGRSREYK